ncbi:MAG: SWF/SNF helicase family protein, partial [Dehalococcoidia bacterium]|nr:SWF/SNF helicase family protein [Dehalococcoidia bacterium]
YDLLEEIAVRRSRHYIRKNYPHAIIDGKPVRFPERKLQTVRYSLDQSYKGLYQELADVIENLNLASYSIDSFRKDVRLQQLSFLDSLKDRLQTQGLSQKRIEELTWRLGRQLALVHIMRTLYLKRLESSMKALRISLERQAKFQEKFLEVLKKGRLLDASSYRWIFERNGTDEVTEGEEVIEEFINQLQPVDQKEYMVEEIEARVRADIKAIKTILAKFPAEEDIPRLDSKLDELKKLLTGELKGKKVVVFSYFKDTARYIYSELSKPDFVKKLGHDKIAIVDSEVKPSERKDRITRFAPKANEALHIKDTDKEINLLISTDVLSEGQNLQDADTVINYDLHWNPVRMIQRVGRI